MMISPESYIADLKGKKYKDILREKDILIRAIKYFESGQCKPNDYLQNPSPEVVYQMNLRYLSAVCELIADKYNEEYINK